jgi:hypothetical protein
MKQHPLSVAAALTIAASSLLRANADQPVDVGQPDIISHRTNPKSDGSPTVGTLGSLSTINYHSGPVMSAPTAYVIWYGNWGQASGDKGQQIVVDFLQGLGASPYFAINASYPGTGAATYGGQTTDAYSQGSRLTDQKIGNIVAAAINSGRLPGDANGVYFVLTSKDVTETSGFCSRYCGWHTHGYLGSLDVKYSFVGNAARCLSACAAQSVGPNGNAGVDAMISVIAHELEEATTDPDLNAWYDSSGAENADKCAWTFGTTQFTVNSTTDSGQPATAYANMTIGSRSYLIQRNLLRGTSKGDICATSYTPSTGAYTQ